MTNRSTLIRAIATRSTNPYAVEAILTPENDSILKYETPKTAPNCSVSGYRKAKALHARIIAAATQDLELQKHIAKREGRVTVLEAFMENPHLHQEAAELLMDSPKADTSVAWTLQARFRPLRQALGLIQLNQADSQLIVIDRCRAAIPTGEFKEILDELPDSEHLKVALRVAQFVKLDELCGLLEAVREKYRPHALATFIGRVETPDWSSDVWNKALDLVGDEPGPAYSEKLTRAVGERGFGPADGAPVSWCVQILETASSLAVRMAAIARVETTEGELSAVIEAASPLEVTALLPLPAYQDEEHLARILEKAFTNEVALRSKRHPFWAEFARSTDLRSTTRYLTVLPPELSFELATRCLALADNYGPRDAVFGTVLGHLMNHPDAERTEQLITAWNRMHPAKLYPAVVSMLSNTEFDSSEFPLRLKVHVLDLLGDVSMFSNNVQLAGLAVEAIDEAFPDRDRPDAWNLVLELWGDWDGSFSELLDTVEASID